MDTKHKQLFVTYFQYETPFFGRRAIIFTKFIQHMHDIASPAGFPYVPTSTINGLTRASFDWELAIWPILGADLTGCYINLPNFVLKSALSEQSWGRRVYDWTISYFPLYPLNVTSSIEVFIYSHHFCSQVIWGRHQYVFFFHSSPSSYHPPSFQSCLLRTIHPSLFRLFSVPPSIHTIDPCNK